MKIFNQISLIRSELSKFQNKKIGLVPTMGALHFGHLSLIDLAKKHCDIVVVSIFVNQKQFNNQEDYKFYPRNLEGDIALLENAKVDMLFCPESEEIYQQNSLTKIIISDLTKHLCGKSRAGHFDAVALIVNKLFNIIKPNLAFFGEKDFQQLQVIRKMVMDLNIDTQIISGATLRENDGLAMSSRNLRLSNSGRKIAGQIYKNLCNTKEQILGNSNSDIDLILAKTTKNLLEIGADKIDYLQICDEENLQPIASFNSKIKLPDLARLFIAIYVDKIRLIDNIKLY